LGDEGDINDTDFEGLFIVLLNGTNDSGIWAKKK